VGKRTYPPCCLDQASYLAERKRPKECVLYCRVMLSSAACRHLRD
jgi:hypothetical protein